jgi:hypothetical protein
MENKETMVTKKTNKIWTGPLSGLTEIEKECMNGLIQAYSAWPGAYEKAYGKDNFFCKGHTR